MSDKGTSWREFREELNLSEDEQLEIRLYAELIERMIEIRESQSLTQRELADLCGVKQPVIARLEKAVHSSQMDTMIKILRPLGYTVGIVPLTDKQGT